MRDEEGMEIAEPDHGIYVVGIGMAALSGMIVGFLLCWWTV